MSRRRILISLLLLVPTALAIYGWMTVRPWALPPDASPEEIARTWAQVEALASESRWANAPIEPLLAAVAEFERARSLPPDDGELHEPPGEIEDEAGRRALAGLAAWGEQGGGLGEELCITDPADFAAHPRYLALFKLARLAIRTSPGGEDPGLAAALRLGAYLRSRGGLLAGAVGFSIAREALAVATARGQTPGAAFTTYAPRREEVLSILAREAVCALRMAEGAFARGEAELEGGEGDPGWPARWIGGWVGPERELAMARWYIGARVEAAMRAGDDLAAVAATQRLPERADELPKSLLVRALVANSASAVAEMEATLTAYAKLDAAVR